MSLSIGERLKSAREAKGIGLDEATRATKVQRKILEAIEQDRIGEVLSLAYAKIFLKKYAVFLGLDGSAVTREYLALHGSVSEAPISVGTHMIQKESTSIRSFLLPAGIGLIALIGISFLGYLALNFYATSSKTKERPKSTAAHRKAKVLPAVERFAAGPKLIVPQSQPLKLTIRAKVDVWMQIKSDGAVIFQNVLHRGDTESWTAKEAIEIWTGNAGAMELSLNGRPLGEIGSGVKKGLKVTHEGVKES